MTTNYESVTAENVTASRAQVHRSGVGVTLSRCHESDRDVTGGRDSDRPPVGGSVTVTPEAEDQIVATVRPWPQYDEHGRGPFWEIELKCNRFTARVGLAAHLGRYVDNTAIRKILFRRGVRQALRQVGAPLSSAYRARLQAEGLL